jgi:hypothetical protein
MSFHITVDVEAPEHLSRMRLPDYSPGEVLRHVEKTLEFLSEGSGKATFFILGDAARRRPEIVSVIARGGHEVASHGFHHRPVHRLPIKDFREDLRTSREMLEDILGAPVAGYRSPAWTLGAAPPDYHAAVFEAGYAYSSSLLPALGFIRGARRDPSREFSPCTIRIGPVSIPAGTSWTFRLIPAARLLRHLEGEGAHVLVVHTHELGGGPPAAGLAPWHAFVRYAGLTGFREKLGILCAAHPSAPLKTLLK